MARVASSRSAEGRLGGGAPEEIKRTLRPAAITTWFPGGATTTVPRAGGIVERGFNGQARPPREDLDEPVRPFGRLVDEDDHGRVEMGRQSAQHLRYSGKAVGGPDQGDDLQALLRSVKRLMHGG